MTLEQAHMVGRNAGADPFTLAAILGHSDIRMTARYTHATDQAKRRAVDNLVKPESNSDASEPDYQQLKAVENPGTGNENGEVRLAVNY